MKYGWSGGSGLSGFFTPEDFLPTHPPLKEDRTADVVVIGGGLSGLLCAYELLKGGRSVCLCTSHTVGNGASRYGAGILCGFVQKLHDQCHTHQLAVVYLLTFGIKQIEKRLRASDKR